MKTKSMMGAFMILFTSIFPLTSAFADEKPTASFNAGFFTKYIWRGFELSKDGLVIQPSATVGYKGFSVNMWGNLDTDYDDGDPTTSNQYEWNETDLTASYAHRFGIVGLDVGYIYYALDKADDAQEFYVGAGLDAPLSPTLTLYRETADLQGWYFSFGLSHSFKLQKGMSLDLSGSAGYYYSLDNSFNEADSDDKYRSFHNGLLSVGLTVPFAEYFTFTPLMAYSFPLSGKAKDLIKSGSYDGDAGFFYGGVTLGISF